jgi:hypothetical protein
VLLVRSRPVWSLTPEVTAKANRLKSWVAMTETHFEKYQKPPPPVDFASAKKKVRDQELVEMLEKFYTSNTPPAEVHSLTPEELEDMEHKLAYARDLDALNKELLPVLEVELEFQVANRTTMETTIHDMKLNYPMIHEEIEDELERREWFKDTGIGGNK